MKVSSNNNNKLFQIKCRIYPQNCRFTDRCTTAKSSGVLQLFIYVDYDIDVLG